MAPALVLLLGEDHVVGEGSAGRSGPDGDQRRRRPGRLGGADRLVRRVRAALVRDRQQQPGADRPAQRLERLDRANLAAGRQVERIGHEHRDGHRGVLGRPAAGRDHRSSRVDRGADLARHTVERGVLGQAPHEALRDRRLRGDHLAHDVGRARPERRHARRRPWLGRPGERLVRRMAWHRRRQKGWRTMSATISAVPTSS